MNLSLETLKGMVDEAKVMVVPKTEVEKRIYEAISNKNWGASSTLMNQIAADTYDYEKYGVVMKQIWTSLDGPGRSWRAVFKALTLLEHLVKNGAERIVEDVRDHMHKIRTLTDFNYYEGSMDRGSGVREKAKQLIELLGDNERIRDERERSRRLRDKFVGIGVTGGSTGISGGLGNMSGGSRYDGFSAQDYHRSEGSGISQERPGRYTDQGARSPSDFGGRGGGGGGERRSAYDPAPIRSSAQQSSKDTGSYDDEPASPAEDDSQRHKAGGGTRRKSKDKIEVRLKKESSKGTIVSPPQQQAKAPAQDLLGDDFFGGDAAGGGGGGGNGFGADPFDDFNPRGNTSAAPAQARPTQQDPFFAAPPAPAPTNFYQQPPAPPAPGGFGNFGAAAPAPAPYDPFAAPSPAPSAAPTYPPTVQASGFGFAPPAPPTPPGPTGFVVSPQQQQQQQPGLNPYGATAAPPSSNPSFGGGFPAPAPSPFGAAPSTGYGVPAPQQQQAPPRGGIINDFGDFQAGPKSMAPAPLPSSAKPSDPWGGLVNLGNLAEEQPKKDGTGVGGATASGSSDHFSFSDLDSFAKSKQQPAPAPYSGAPRPPQPTGMAPMAGYGAPQSMVGNPYGAPSAVPHMQQQAAQQYGGPSPFGAPAPAQQQYGAPQQPGGYPSMQNPYGAAPQGGFGYQQPPHQQGFGMQPGYPQQQQQQQFPPQQQYGAYAQQQQPGPFGRF